MVTASKKKVYGIQFIGDRLTLTGTNVTEDGKIWVHAELRTAYWSQRYNLVMIAELLATLWLQLDEQKVVLETMNQEINGIIAVPQEKSVRNVIPDMVAENPY